MKKIIILFLISLLSASFAYGGTWGVSIWDHSIFGSDSPTDNDKDGYLSTEGDCNDNNPSINPDAVEICDSIDNNCNGRVDENIECDTGGGECLVPPTSEETIVLITAEDIANAPVIYSISSTDIIKSLGFKTNFPCYSFPVDIYLLMITPDERLIFISSDNTLTESLVPYVTNQKDEFKVSESNISVAMDGNYIVGWFLAPANGGDVLKCLEDGMYILGAYVLLN